MNYETQLINSVIDSDNWAEALGAGVGDLVQDHADVWTFISDYHMKYDTLPTKTILREKFAHFDLVSTKETPFQYYLDEAKKQSMSKALRNNLGKTIELLKDNGPQTAMNFIASSTFKLMRETGTLKDTNLTQDYLERVKDYQARFESDSHIMGIPSGIRPLDEIFGGFQPGDFVILMGWTGSMKSWLSLLFAINAWRDGYRPLLISLEMNRYQTGYRLDTVLGAGTKFTNDQLTHAKDLDPRDYEAWARDTFEGTHPLYVVTSDGMDVATQTTIESKIEYYKPDMVIVDYHQLVEDSKRGGTETEKNKNISKDFKRLAQKYQVPIIDICAVTMKPGEQQDRAPRLEEIAWSKQLAYDADLVLSIYRERGSSILQVVSEKVRRCSEFAFNLDWDINRGIWSEQYGAIHNGIEF